MNIYGAQISIDKGKGIHVWDSNGNKYLDFVCGLGSCIVGHANEQVSKAILAQSKKIVNPSNYYNSEAKQNLCDKLEKITGLPNIFLSNSGTEANEAAIKLAKAVSGKKNFISTINAFHGRTLGSLSATWKENYKKDYLPLVEGFDFVEFGNANAIKEKITEETAAVILEPIQGEAGIILPKEDYLKEVKEICESNNVLLLLDEVQTGCGRTGKFFCYEHSKIIPDIVTTSKGLANGLPIGVTIASEGLAFKKGQHGTTFGGNSVSCAAAIKTIELIEKEIPFVEEKAQFLLKKILSTGKVENVWGRGLMIGIKPEIKDFGKKCFEKALIVNQINDEVTRLLPPITATKKQFVEATKIIGVIE
jgi:predicted acetylornithine/succinylornithine family transaminase